MVGRATTGGPGIVGKGRCRLEHLPGLGWIEQEGQPPIRLPASRSIPMRCIQALLADSPVKKTSEYSNEVVGTAGPVPWPGGNKLIEQARGEVRPIGQGKEQVQCRFLAQSPPSGGVDGTGLPSGEEAFNGSAEALHRQEIGEKAGRWSSQDKPCRRVAALPDLQAHECRRC